VADRSGWLPGFFLEKIKFYICHVKVLSWLLILLVSGLSLVPCCDPAMPSAAEKNKASSCCAEKTCGEEKKDANSSDHENSCSSCSPFFVCGTCVGFVFNSQSFNLQRIYASAGLSYSRYNVRINSEYFNQQWQPPKIDLV
jgi:hypothetical protein